MRNMKNFRICWKQIQDSNPNNKLYIYIYGLDIG